MRKAGLLALATLSLATVSVVFAQNRERVRVALRGYQEAPAISTVGRGEFRAQVSDDEIEYELSYSNLEGNVLQAHIHLGQRSVNGGISVFLCTNIGGGPAGRPPQPCPPSPGTVRGTLTAADVIGPTGQGIAPTEFAELVRAIRSGVTYANVHSSKFPGGEIRGQLPSDKHSDRDHDDDDDDDSDDRDN